MNCGDRAEEAADAHPSAQGPFFSPPSPMPPKPATIVSVPTEEVPVTRTACAALAAAAALTLYAATQPADAG
jgi:hypothetical protein